MSVRDALTGVLTLGPTYGHQLLFELHTRLPHRAVVNPGQVYATLNRVRASGGIIDGGVTETNLPLYKLTSDGQRDAHAWLRGETPIDVGDWTEVFDVVLLAFTLPHVSVGDTCYGLSEQLKTWCTVATSGDEDRHPLIATGRARHAAALQLWLDDVAHESAGPTRVTWGFNEQRPGRGRRPNLVK
ncbi:MAG: PadR family transcriptional regulator [Microbacteriaceae bacterium]|nr:PadR family transcriptional regulator [Microbacteriaceae bacterium]